jgi:hypothetical protein
MGLKKGAVSCTVLPSMYAITSMRSMGRGACIGQMSHLRIPCGRVKEFELSPRIFEIHFKLERLLDLNYEGRNSSDGWKYGARSVLENAR